MTKDRRAGDRPAASPPVAFFERFASSEKFMAFFSEGMALVEETANYLDGDGRRDAQALDQERSLLYASESMRLTTRLMQIASWLLLHRAVKEGEMSLDQAAAEKAKISLQSMATDPDDPRLAGLPAGLKALIARSAGLERRAAHYDRHLYAKINASISEQPNTVHAQIGQLNAAFPDPD